MRAGTTATVTEIRVSSDQRGRLLEMGLLVGTPVELVRYPRSTHDLSRSGEPWLLVDRLGRLRQWFAYWLMDKKTVADARAVGSEK